jgi:ribosomal protein S18 acetylase RimI-like enzyme
MDYVTSTYLTSIRKIEDRDLGQVAQLFDEYRQFYEQPSDRVRAEQYIRARTENNESVILVAENANGNLDGFCQLYPTFCSVQAEPIYVLYDLFVAPAARRRGVAKELLDGARRQARADGKARLDLSTAKSNLKAQALYESLGWRRDNEFYTYSLDLGD